MTTTREVEWWKDHGYLYGKPIGGGLWICLAKMMFTYRLMLCSEWAVEEFYCYPHERLPIAIQAFAAWEGIGDPLDGWVKHHPSHRRNP